MTDTRYVIPYRRISKDDGDVELDTQRQLDSLDRLQTTLPPELSALPILAVDEPGGISASKNSIFDRPGGAALMARVEQGEVAAILVDQQSRLSRFEDDREWATFTMLLLAQQTRLFAADVGEIDLKNHAARSMAYMRRLGDAEWAAKIGHNTATRIAAIARRGFWPFGQVPFGYDAEGETKQRLLVPNDDAPVVVEPLRGLSLAGASIQALTRSSGLARERVKKILRNEAYYGVVRHLDARHDGQHVPLITKELFDQAQALLRRNAAEQPSYSLKNPYGFLLRCDACGYGCMQHVSNRASQLAYYRCVSAGRAASTASLLSTSTPASSSASPRRPSACTNAWTIRPGAFCAQTQSSGLPRRRRWPGWTRRSLTRSNSSAAGLPVEKIETRLAAIQTEREKLSRQLALLSGRRQSPSGEPRGAARPPERHRGTHRYRGLRRVLHLGLGRHELRAAPVTPPRASRVDPSRRRPHGHHLQGRHPSASADHRRSPEA